MSFGMTWEQYWYGDVRMTKSFYEAYKLRKKEENQRLWLQGLYFCDALQSQLANFGAGLSGKHGSARYAEKPYDIFPEKKTQAQEEAELHAMRQRMHDRLDAVVKAAKERKETLESL